MLPRDFINNVSDAQHSMLDGIKALLDMQTWYAQKTVDEIEKYTKYLRPVEKK